MQSAIYVVLKELLRIEVDPNLFCSKSMLLQMEGSWLSCFSDLIVIWHIVIVQKVGSNPSWLSCSWSSDRRLLSPPAVAAARPSPSSCSLQWATILPTVSIEIGRNLIFLLRHLKSGQTFSSCSSSSSSFSCSLQWAAVCLTVNMNWIWSELWNIESKNVLILTSQTIFSSCLGWWNWQVSERNNWTLLIYAMAGNTTLWLTTKLFQKVKKQKLYVNYLWTESVSN